MPTLLFSSFTNIDWNLPVIVQYINPSQIAGNLIHTPMVKSKVFAVVCYQRELLLGRAAFPCFWLCHIRIPSVA